MAPTGTRRLCAHPQLDRLELAPLRQQLEERWRSVLKQLKESTPRVEADDAAGIRKWVQRGQPGTMLAPFGDGICAFLCPVCLLAAPRSSGQGFNTAPWHGGPQFATLAVRQTPQHRTGFPVPLGWFPWGSGGRTCPELLETGEAQGWNTRTHGTRGAPSAPSAPSPFCSHIPRQDPKRPSLLQHPMLPPTPILPAGSCWPISTACPATDPCTCWCLDREFWGARMLPGFGWVLEVGPCPVPSYLVGTRLRDTGGRPQGRVAHCPPHRLLSALQAHRDHSTAATAAFARRRAPPRHLPAGAWPQVGDVGTWGSFTAQRWSQP